MKRGIYWLREVRFESRRVPLGDALTTLGRWRGSLLSLWVFLGFFVLLLVVYGGTLTDVPRSDHLIVFAIFDHLSFPADFSKIAFVEFFGDKRFQPLAFLMHFFQIKMFGDNFVLYHLVVVFLHALNGALIFRLLRLSSRSNMFAILGATLFVVAATHLEAVAWPFHFYILLHVTLMLLAVLSLVKFKTSSNTIFLYLSYLLAFLQMFLYEPGVIFPAFLFLASALLWRSYPNRKHLIQRSFLLTAAVYFLFAAGYVQFLASDVAAFPPSLARWANIQRALAGSFALFFNTSFLHNTIMMPHFVVSDLVYFQPYSLDTLIPMAASPLQPDLLTPGATRSLLIVPLLLGLLILARKPAKEQAWFLLLIALFGFFYATTVCLGRPLGYIISQSRYAFLPTLVLVVVGLHFFEPYFSGVNLWRSKARKAGLLVFAIFVFLAAVNLSKSWSQVHEIERYLEYTNSVYYAAKDFVSRPENYDKKLFVALPTYPPHGKFAWASDIVPNLFLYTNPRITPSVSQATHIMRDLATIEPLPPIEYEAEKPVAKVDFTSSSGTGYLVLLR